MYNDAVISKFLLNNILTIIQTSIFYLSTYDSNIPKHSVSEIY